MPNNALSPRPDASPELWQQLVLGLLVDEHDDRTTARFEQSDHSEVRLGPQLAQNVVVGLFSAEYYYQ